MESSKKNANRKFNINKLYLASILRYEGIKEINLNLVKDWTFVTYAIIYKDKNGEYHNAINEKEKYSKIVQGLNPDINAETIDIISGANIVLRCDNMFCSKKYITKVMKESNLYFRDVEDEYYKSSDDKLMVKTIVMR